MLIPNPQSQFVELLPFQINQQKTEVLPLVSWEFTEQLNCSHSARTCHLKEPTCNGKRLTMLLWTSPLPSSWEWWLFNQCLPFVEANSLLLSLDGFKGNLSLLGILAHSFQADLQMEDIECHPCKPPHIGPMRGFPRARKHWKKLWQKFSTGPPDPPRTEPNPEPKGSATSVAKPPLPKAYLVKTQLSTFWG